MPTPFYMVDLSLPSVDLVYALINNDNDTAYTSSKLTLGIPSTAFAGSPKNRNTVVAASRVGYPLDNLSLYYDRLNLAKVNFHNTQITIAKNVGDNHTYDLLPRLNTALGTNLAENDIINYPISTGASTIVITMNPESYAWQGTFTVHYE